MNTGFPAFDRVLLDAGRATHPLARLDTRLPLSLVVTDPGLSPPRFAADTCPDAPSGAFNPSFQNIS
ncbi:MAG: hypothetical protein Q8L71_08455 [Thiobacillus sp.]|nr:hypothetical protein [Thiobacillus sp.]